MRDWPRHDLLRHRAATTPDRPALITTATGATQDWATLDTVVARLASTIADQVAPGDRIGVVLSNGTPFIATYWAIVRLGGTVVPVDPDRPPTGLGDRLRRAGVMRVLTDDAIADQVRPVLDVPVDPVTDRVHPGPDVDASGTGTVPPRDRHPNDEQVVLFTSGTTGTPKGVRLTDRNLLMSAVGSAFRLGIHPDDRWLTCLPMHHMGGLAPIVRTAAYGTTLVVQPAFDVDTTPTVIRDHGITGVSMVPTMLHRLLDRSWDPPPQLGTVLLGGAAAGQPLVEAAIAADVPLYVTYGLTEAASQVTTAPPRLLAEKPTTVGRPLLVTDVTILTEDGEVCPPGEVGELHVDGPTVAAYLDRETTADATTDRGLATGDLASRDEDGHVYIHGRLDEQILTGGETVSPSTVEDALRDHPDIVAAAVVGIDDPEWGERVSALLETRRDTDLTVDEVDAFCSEHLAPFERPKTIVFTDELPRTASGTVDKATVRKRIRSATGDDHI